MTGDDRTTLELVRYRWTEIKELIAAQHQSAGIALEAASVAAVRDGEVHLAFANDFWRRTIEADGDCRATIQTVIAEVAGVQLGVRAYNPQHWAPVQPEAGSPLRNQAIASGIFLRILGLYPSDYRIEFGDEPLQDFRQGCREHQLQLWTWVAQEVASALLAATRAWMMTGWRAVRRVGR